MTEEKREEKLCVFCGKSIAIEAKKCRHCKNWVEEQEEKIKHQEKLPETKTCPQCFCEIPYKARKCSKCLSDVEILDSKSSTNLRKNLDSYESHKRGNCFKCGYEGELGVCKKSNLLRWVAE